MSFRRSILWFLIAMVLVTGPSAAAQQSLQIRIREAGLDENGFVRLVVSVTGGPAAERVLETADFEVTEEEERVEGLEAQPLLESAAIPVGVVLAMDVSGSTRGAPIADARAAAAAFVRQLPQEVQIAVVAFAADAQVRSDFSTDKQAALNAIDALQPAGETALYRGVSLAAELSRRIDGQRNIVLFSDGGDTVSGITLDDAVNAVKEANAALTSVGLVTPESDQAALDRLASESNSRSIPVSASAELSAAFGQVAQEIASQYILTYTESRDQPKELDLEVLVRLDEDEASDTIVAFNPRVPELPESVAASPPVGALGTPLGFYLGLAAATVAILIFFALVFYRPTTGRVTRALKRGVDLYSARSADSLDQKQKGLSTSDLTKRAGEFIGQLPKPKGLEERTQLLIDKAGWPLRANEFIGVRVGAALAGVIFGRGLFGSWLLGFVFGIAGGFLPKVILKMKGNRRSNLFVTQLPDTLQLLSASLQAGYGLLQALDTVVREAPAPTSTEFARVLTEARLGMPLEEALESMARRLGSQDFSWVVLAINIQRQVGGNLSQLLITVGNTIREREQLRGTIKALSAEGRMSAYILMALPPLLALYMSVVNPEYIGTLFGGFVGLSMVVIAIFFMTIGYFWMRKIVKMDV